MGNNSTALLLAAVIALAVQPATAQEDEPTLPDGPGKRLFVANCGACHGLNRARAGYTAAGWHTVVRMMQNFGVALSRHEWSTLTDYLIASFPEPSRPPAVVIGGSIEATIKLFTVPTPGSRPHDPLAARDGSIWYTGQMSNRLGRLDPATGMIKEYPLPTPHTGPHGLAEDRTGNIWYTGNHAGLVGKLDPKTGRVSEYRDARLARRGTRTPSRSMSDGVVWFTLQQANMIGRLDPSRRSRTACQSRRRRRRGPTGCKSIARACRWWSLFGTNKIATVDPHSMAITEHALPNPAARPRRLTISRTTDLVHRFRPWLSWPARPRRPAQHKEWLSPSGVKSRPYGIVFARGAVWYSESFAKPNTIVRFDPQTEKFQSWEIPGGGDIVRNMDVTREGNPVTANSLTNQIGLIEVEVKDQ